MTTCRRVRAIGSLALALLVIMVLPAMIPASAAGQEIDVSKLGPQVGERVPEFTMTDQNGAEQTLRSVVGPNGAVVVLFRSADW